MAIVQISKIQQRSGNLVDLPQLDEAEFGWASDAKRLFIGKTTPNENVEVLTSYSTVSFSQIEGAYGNLDIANAVVTGQLMTYNKISNTWVNTGGNALDPGNSSYFSNTPVHLGNIANVKIGGGAIGYVLETDGQGNLSWTSKGTLRANITGITRDAGNANIIVVTVPNTTPYTNSTAITISGANGVSNTVVNGNTFYIKVAGDFATSGNVRLYSDIALTTAVTSTNISYTNTTNLAIAVTSLGSTGAAAAGGSNTTIQFNNNNILDGDADFTYNLSTNLLTLNGNANVANLISSGVVSGSNLVSNVATGTAPLTVTSTTRVSNLSVAYSNVSDFGVTTVQTTGTFFPVFVNGSSTANRALAANANLGFNAATGNLSATILNANTTIAAGTTITATGNVTGSNLLTAGGVIASTLTSNVAVGTAPLTVTSTTRVANLNVAYANVADFVNANLVTTGTFYPLLANATSGNVTESANANLSFNAATGALSSTLLGGTLTTAAQPNVTSLGTLSSVTVTGTATVGNIQKGGTAGDTLNIYGAGNTNVNGAGGIIQIFSGDGNGTGAGGALSLNAGTANASGNAAGGQVEIVAGDGYGQGQGGTVGIYSGISGNTYGAKGGNVVITGGTYDGAGGDMTLSGGEAAGLNHIGGDITIKAGASSGNAVVGKVVFQTSTPSSTGNTVQTLSDRVIIDDTQMNVRFTTASSSTTTGALEVAGGVGVGGNVYAAAFYGAATGLTSIPGGNVSGTVANATHASTANTVVNAAQANITSVGTLTSLGVNGTATAVAFTANTGVFTGNGNGLSSLVGANVTGNVANATYAVSAGTAGTVTTAAQGNITSVSSSFTNLTFANAQTISGNNMILTTGANTNAGTITGNWSLTTGSRLNATYADLAEYYEADQHYEPGTVLEFGGEKEVTLAQDGTTRVAGVVSTDPAYAMNMKCPGIAIPVALQGRVPTKVRGSVRKGDMMVSAGNGYARPWNNPQMGTVIGKALENFDGVEGIIEVAVGRL